MTAAGRSGAPGRHRVSGPPGRRHAAPLARSWPPPGTRGGVPAAGPRCAAYRARRRAAFPAIRRRAVKAGVRASGWSADEGEDFVADGGHGVMAGCFDVEAEQGLGVGGAEVEPAAVAEVDGEPVEPVGRYAGAGVGGLDLVQLAGDVVRRGC